MRIKFNIYKVLRTAPAIATLMFHQIDEHDLPLLFRI